ncbi:GFA family protein [Comamonas sp. Tr-654]|uniref:GFA family protein n=1 Tax=Comamonas sp. Tr-654 TaxID=2608341 RepID=UPI00141DAAB7|nr:GFA family protein [Comamonas sp. Tr-654]NIF82078.1 GFA family protein [Comamonas sp. Tr-654]
MSGPIPEYSRPLQAACHCGAVRFTVLLSDGLNTARRCNCSFCRMRGAVAVSAELSGIEVLQGQDALTLYQFNTGQAKHFFCKHCGIYTFHQRRSSPHQYGVNVACIEGMSPFDFAEVVVSEGRSHPSDRRAGTAAGKPLAAGWLRYDANALLGVQLRE